MLENSDRKDATPPKFPTIEFLRVELSPLGGGGLAVAVRATSVDEPEPECFELVDLELANNQVATLDAALALVSEHARRSFATS